MATDAQGTPTPDWVSQLIANLGTSGGTGGGLDNLLQSTLLGSSGRRGLTSQPLVGLMPRWAAAVPALNKAVMLGQVDPYLPTTNPQTWQVYTGRGAGVAGTADIPTKGGKMVLDTNTPTGDNTRTVSSVANDPLLWSEDEIKKAIKKFNDAGMTNVNDLPSLQQAWGQLAQMAGARYSLSSGKIKVTPWDMLDLYKKTNTGSGSGGGGGFTGTHSSVQKTVSQISQGDAWASLRQTTQQLLGHDPSDQEVRDFAYRMNSLAAQNPTISHTTGTYADGALTNSTTKTTGGFTANDVQEHAYDDAQSDPDYAEFQSATTYFNAALSALGEIGG